MPKYNSYTRFAPLTPLFRDVLPVEVLTTVW